MSAEEVNECTDDNCVCRYIRPLHKIPIDFASSKWSKNVNVKQIYIEKKKKKKNSENEEHSEEVEKIPRKDLTIHHYKLTQDVAYESKSCHLVREYGWNCFLKIYFEIDCPSHVITEILRAEFHIRDTNGGKFCKFEFFGHSASQQREGICVLFNKEIGTWRDVIGQYGQFEKITNVSKFSARVGLLLSTTVDGIFVDDSCITKIEDVERNGFCFTDGCGLISFGLAERLSQQLRLKHIPTVFQIRLKGCKGTVALDVKLDRKEQIVVRGSVEKFQWKLPPPFFLGVVEDGVSRPYTYGNLNKQFIQLLSANGIDDEIFLKIQDDYFRELELLESNFELALKYLCVEEKWELAERLTETGEIDSEIKTVLENIRLKVKKPPNYKEENKLKKKKNKEEAKRLKIPVWLSRNLFGICDQSNRLNSGEIFVRITENGQPKTLQDGTIVVVMRSPSYSAGDCRILKCRNVKELEHLVDCVVFSVKGKLQ